MNRVVSIEAVGHEFCGAPPRWHARLTVKLASNDTTTWRLDLERPDLKHTPEDAAIAAQLANEVRERAMGLAELLDGAIGELTGRGMIAIKVPDSGSVRHTLRLVAEYCLDERNYLNGDGNAHGGQAEAFEKIREAIASALRTAEAEGLPLM